MSDILTSDALLIVAITAAAIALFIAGWWYGYDDGKKNERFNRLQLTTRLELAQQRISELESADSWAQYVDIRDKDRLAAEAQWRQHFESLDKRRRRPNIYPIEHIRTEAHKRTGPRIH